MPTETVTNIALNHLLLLAENDLDQAFTIEELVPPLSAYLRLGDGSRWIVSVVGIED